MPCCLAPHPCCAWTEKAPGIPCKAAYCTAGAQIHVLGLLAPCCTTVTKRTGTGKLFPPGSHRREACTGGMQGSCSGHPRRPSALFPLGTAIVTWLSRALVPPDLLPATGYLQAPPAPCILCIGKENSIPTTVPWPGSPVITGERMRSPPERKGAED